MQKKKILRSYFIIYGFSKVPFPDLYKAVLFKVMTGLTLA